MISVLCSFSLNFIKLFLIIKFVKKNRKIIVIAKVLHLGDIVACEPVAENYRLKFPDAFIIWCVKKNYRDLIDSNPVIDYTLPVKCVIEWQFLVGTNIFDLVVDLHIDNRICHFCNLPLKKKIGNSGITFENYYEYGNLINVFCCAAKIEVPEIEPKIYINQEVFENLEKFELNDPYVTIHCQSNENCRDWSLENWLELMRVLNIFCPKVKIVEIGLAPILNEGSLRNYISLCGKLSILESAAVIKRGSVFIGIDSGPAHLANAVHSKSLILLGNYRSFSHYMPYAGFFAESNSVRILRSDGAVSDLSVDIVWAELQCLLDV
jgi:ADP-heptose:LPS heptosyltransferase